MILAEIDLGQVIIIVIAMVAGFVQWVWGLIQQSRQERERQRQGPSSPSREEPGEAPPMRSRPSPNAPPPVQDPWNDMREMFERMKREAEKARQPQRRPAPAQKRPSPIVRAPAAATMVAAEPPPTPVQAAFPPVSAVAESRPALAPHDTRTAHPLAQLLRQPASLRQAVILREVLGPPKALQSSGDAAC